MVATVAPGRRHRGRSADLALRGVSRAVLAAASPWAAVETRAIGLALTALIGIFLLLQAAFGSWRLAFLRSTVPSRCRVALIAAVIDSRVFSLGTLAGLLAVLATRAGNDAPGEQVPDAGTDVEPRSVPIVHVQLTPVAPVRLSARPWRWGCCRCLVLVAGPVDELLHPLAIAVLGGLARPPCSRCSGYRCSYLHLAPKTVAAAGPSSASSAPTARPAHRRLRPIEKGRVAMRSSTYVTLGDRTGCRPARGRQHRRPSRAPTSPRARRRLRPPW